LSDSRILAGVTAEILAGVTAEFWQE
jgi:hypothetical protein